VPRRTVRPSFLRAPGYASAYTRYTADCGDGVLSFDFALLPQIR